MGTERNKYIQITLLAEHSLNSANDN